MMNLDFAIIATRFAPLTICAIAVVATYTTTPWRRLPRKIQSAIHLNMAMAASVSLAHAFTHLAALPAAIAIAAAFTAWRWTKNI